MVVGVPAGAGGAAHLGTGPDTDLGLHAEAPAEGVADHRDEIDGVDLDANAGTGFGHQVQAAAGTNTAQLVDQRPLDDTGTTGGRSFGDAQGDGFRAGRRFRTDGSRSTGVGGGGGGAFQTVPLTATGRLLRSNCIIRRLADAAAARPVADNFVISVVVRCK